MKAALEEAAVKKEENKNRFGNWYAVKGIPIFDLGINYKQY